MRLLPPTNAQEAENNCTMTKNWAFTSKGQTPTDDEKRKIESSCAGPWGQDENGNWIQEPKQGIMAPITTTTTTTTQTAGLGDNKMIIWLVVGGITLWYLNKEGYLKKILK